MRFLHECIEAGRTQSDLAKLLGVSRAHINSVLNGRSKLSVARAHRWATTLGTDPMLAVQDALQAQLPSNMVATLRVSLRTPDDCEVPFDH
jgi:plasmid maintenance system antidote protein VapI